MEKYMDWDSDFSGFDSFEDECGRLGDKVKSHACRLKSKAKDRKDCIFAKIEEYAKKGQEVMEDEEMRKLVKIAICVIIGIIILCVIVSAFKKRR